MRQKLVLAALGAGAIALAGCAKTTPVDNAPSPSMSADDGSNARWTANIQSVTQSRGEVVQTTRYKSYGSATWTHGMSASLSNVNVVFTYAGQERTLAWGILPGSCGTPALPVIPMSNFPELNIGGGGRAQVTTSLPLDLPSNGTYHVAIYKDRRQGADALVACGNLRYAK